MRRVGAAAARFDEAWLRYLIPAGLAAVAVAFSHRWWGTWGSSALQLTTGVAVIAGIRRYRPVRAGFWWLLAAGQLGYAVAQAYWRIRFDGWKPDIPFRSVDDGLYFLAFGLFIAALATRGLVGVPWARRRANVVDGLVVVLALSSGTWRFIAEPFLSTHRLDALGATLFWTYEGLELARMAFLAMIVLSGTVRTGAQRLLVAGILIQLGGDLAYSVGLPSAGSPADGWQNLAWLLGSIVLAAAALHPGMAHDDQPRAGADTLPRSRLVVFVLLTMVSPIMTGLDALFGARAQPTGESSLALGVWIPMILGVSVSALLVLRMGMLAGLAHRRATALDAALREQEVLRAQLEHRATHDPLTGLGNRALLLERLAAALERPAAARGWLLLIDLDGFKQVNDTLGHPVGDDLLVRLAGRFRDLVPEATVVRLGGDEFAILLGGVQAAAIAVAEAVLVAAAGEQPCPGQEIRVSASIGVLALGAVAEVSHALKDADVALYAAKAAGRNRYQVAGELIASR